mgnify:CR=1 FL=1
MVRPILSLLLFILSFGLMAQGFPAETIVCRRGSFTLEKPAEITGPAFQWERSFDGGGSWNLISGANGSSTTISNPTPGISYRLRFAADPACLADLTCAAVTNATRLAVQIPSFAQSAVICQGDTVWVGNEPLTTGGNHETIINQGECDSIVSTFVLINRSYDQLVVATLCPGELFQGETFTSDTIYQQQFSTVQGCDSVVTYEIEVSNLANLTIDGTSEICAGETTEFNIAGQFADISWSNGEQASTISPVTAGTYRATVTNSQGCSIALEQELIIEEVTAQVILTEPTCPGTPTGQLQINGHGEELLYSFDGGTTFSLTNNQATLTAGAYDLVVENYLGCQWQETVELPDAAPIALYSSQDERIQLERGDSIQLSVSADFPVENWSWTGPGGLSCMDCPTPVATPLYDADYTLTATATGECTVTAAFTITVLDDRRFYAPTAFSPNSDGENDHWQLYPGPKTQTIANFTILDRWGGLIYHQPDSLPADDDRLHWDGNNRGQPMETGVYAYTATLIYESGRKQVVSGTVNLMR